MTEDRIRKYAIVTGAAFAAAGSAGADIISSTGASTVNDDTTSTLFSFQGVSVIAGNRTDPGYWAVRVADLFSSRTTSAHNLALHQAANSGSTIQSDWINVGSAKQSFVQKENFNNTGTNTKITSIDPGTNHLAAFSIFDGTDRYFGWIDYTLEANGSVSDPLNFVINSWAYNDVSGEGIIAGQNTAASGGGAAPVPGLGGLAALAIGAAGLRTRRQRIS
jgi:hypothetical protein